VPDQIDPKQSVPDKGDVGGADGTPPPAPAPAPAPAPLPDPKQDADPKTAVGGADGTPPDPKQGVPDQTDPKQAFAAPPDPSQTPPKDTDKVTLDNVDKRESAKLTSSNGDSVEVWGDPHVVVDINGQKSNYEIGYGKGSFSTDDGNTISWDTYAKGAKHQYVLKDFSVNGPGTADDHTVQTFDGKDAHGLSTALTDTDLQAFAAYLETKKAPMNTALKPDVNTGQTPPGQVPPPPPPPPPGS
jgi:hypothetical protein